MITRIDIAPLFGPLSADRDAADEAIGTAAADTGFMTVTGYPFDNAAGPDDPLCEATPLPREDVLPGWRTGAQDYTKGDRSGSWSQHRMWTRAS